MRRRAGFLILGLAHYVDRLGRWALGGEELHASELSNEELDRRHAARESRVTGEPWIRGDCGR